MSCLHGFAAGAERRILALAEQCEVAPLAYVNRLSDYLFVLSRKINWDEKKMKYFGIIVVSERFLLYFLPKKKTRQI